MKKVLGLYAIANTCSATPLRARNDKKMKLTEVELETIKVIQRVLDPDQAGGGMQGAGIASKVAEKIVDRISEEQKQAQPELKKWMEQHGDKKPLTKLVNNQDISLRSLELVNIPGRAGFYTTLYIGSKHQKFQLLLDTGSSDFVVPSVECMNCGDEWRDKNGYKSKESTTSNDTQVWKDLSYQRNFYIPVTNRGKVIKDNIFLTDNLKERELVNAQVFVSIRVIDFIPVGYNDSISVLGLGPQSTFIRALASQEKIVENKFTIYNDSVSDQSRIWFGGYDSNFIRSFPAYQDASDEVIDRSFAYVPIEQKYIFESWTMALPQVIIKGIDGVSKEPVQDEIVKSFDPKAHVQFDSGSPLNFIPKVSMDRIYKFFSVNNIPCSKSDDPKVGLGYSDGFLCQCTPKDLSNFPTFKFVVGDFDFDLEPNAYMTVIDSTLPVDQEQGCYLTIVYHDSLSIWVLGAPFMRQYLMSFDIAKQRVGLLCANPLIDGEKKNGTHCTANPVIVKEQSVNQTTIVNQGSNMSDLFWPILGVCIALLFCMICVVILLCRIHKKAHEEKFEAKIEPVAAIAPVIVEAVKPQMKNKRCGEDPPPPEPVKVKIYMMNQSIQCDAEPEEPVIVIKKMKIEPIKASARRIETPVETECSQCPSEPNARELLQEDKIKGASKQIDFTHQPETCPCVLCRSKRGVQNYYMQSDSSSHLESDRSFSAMLAMTPIDANRDLQQFLKNEVGTINKEIDQVDPKDEGQIEGDLQRKSSRREQQMTAKVSQKLESNDRKQADKAADSFKVRAKEAVEAEKKAVEGFKGSVMKSKLGIQNKINQIVEESKQNSLSKEEQNKKTRQKVTENVYASVKNQMDQVVRESINKGRKQIENAGKLDNLITPAKRSYCSQGTHLVSEIRGASEQSQSTPQPEHKRTPSMLEKARRKSSKSPKRQEEDAE